MGLMKGGYQPPEQQVQNGMDDEESRKMRRGQIIYLLRRKWRMICLKILAPIASILALVYWATSGFQGGLFGAVYAIAGGLFEILVLYAVVTFLFLYLLINFVLKIYLYFFDLKNSEGTRL